MTAPLPDQFHDAGRIMSRLARDKGGNVIMIVAASLFPLLALIGSGVDMGRAYLAETRLQAACDAGTLAARKRLGTAAVAGGDIPAEVAETGQRFFNINFRAGGYGTENRQFFMVLENNNSISGTAAADVPTSIMGAFGFESIAVSASCVSQLNMPNTDIMMVLDTTGSMLLTNPGDTQSRIDALRNTVKSFHTQMEGSKAPGTQIRYGFLPYSTNVNVGHLLEDGWLVDEWKYNFREGIGGGRTEERTTYDREWQVLSGTREMGETYYASECPAYAVTSETLSEETDAAGWTHRITVYNGTSYHCDEVDGSTVQVRPQVHDAFTERYSWIPTGTETIEIGRWRYGSLDFDLSFLGTQDHTQVPMGGNPANPSNVTVRYRGCIEERSTYEIKDYSNVDLLRALDLDLDSEPNPNDPDTQWRPMLNELSYIREIKTNGRGQFTPGAVISEQGFINAWWWGFGACPSPARELAEMSSQDVATYVDGLNVQGSTYHDIGMIWGGRLLSPTGLFADDESDSNGQQISRHMIYLTDGETAPLDISYGAYGIEPLDRRRWTEQSRMSLTDTVEARFAFACEEVKKRNIQVWVINFGSASNPLMETCAGTERYYVADDAAELEATFSDIARRMGELRLVD